MNIVLLGPPGAGKGTQGERIAAKLGIPKLATGAVLRAAVKDGTTLGREAKAFMDRGDLVPDGVILGIMKEALASPAMSKGVILDGVVRTTPQAEGLDLTLRQLGKKLDAVLLFEIDEDELVRRLSGRTTCESCQTPYTGREPGTICEKCGGRLVRRKDDEPDAIRRRMAVYREQTEPVVAWYEDHGARIVRVDAVGSLDDVQERALQALQS